MSSNNDRTARQAAAASKQRASLLVVSLLALFVLGTIAKLYNDSALGGGEEEAPVEATARVLDAKATTQEAWGERIRICRSRKVTATNSIDTLEVQYQCKGESYQRFGQRLSKFVEQQQNFSSWLGRRPFPLPSNSSVLVLGNSHLRQITIALLCQYGDKLSSIKPCPVMLWKQKIFERRCLVYAFDDIQSTITVIINDPFIFSPEWQQLLRRMTNISSLQAFDAVVLGQFNLRTGYNTTGFYREMSRVSLEPDNSVDFFHVDPPNPQTFAAVYDPNKLIVVSGFDDSPAARRHMSQAAPAAQVINARKYFAALGECQSSNRLRPSTACKQISTGHRCAGPHGGHGDLIAWDVIERLHDKT